MIPEETLEAMAIPEIQPVSLTAARRGPPLGKDPPGPRGENPETSKMEKQSVTKYSV